MGRMNKKIPIHNISLYQAYWLNCKIINHCATKTSSIQTFENFKFANKFDQQTSSTSVNNALHVTNSSVYNSHRPFRPVVKNAAALIINILLN